MLKPLSGRKAVWNMTVWSKLDGCVAKLNTDAGGPFHPFRVSPHHHPLATVSLSLTVPPLTSTLAVGEVRGRIGLLS